MSPSPFWQMYGEAAKTAVGFFWKSGWAFVMGYAVSAMIQAFVPRDRLTRHMGTAGPESIGLATLFGAASSSCSFAALATARALIAKGAHFIAGVAFMFASTNLVIELGMLILVFLGWQYLVAELVGGVILIAISWALMAIFYPRTWLQEARDKVEGDVEERDSFSPWERIRSREGWYRVGKHFVDEWMMVWREITIGFTVAGFMKVFVPAGFWEAIFLIRYEDRLPAIVLALENAVVAPFVAAMTFIGSMGNIPLAAVLASSGVAFAGIMGFIYSDLMVPPLVRVNARYYGWKVAVYIAGIMFVSIVCTALILHFGFLAAGMTPGGADGSAHGSQFGVDYTLFLNGTFALVAAVMAWLYRRYRRSDLGGEAGGHGGIELQTVVTFAFLAILAVGLVAFAITGGMTAP